MTTEDENIQVTEMSKFNKITLTILAGLLLFAGPTYVPYLLFDTLKLDYVLSITVGGVLFIIGLVMLFWLIRKKIIS